MTTCEVVSEEETRGHADGESCCPGSAPDVQLLLCLLCGALVTSTRELGSLFMAQAP